MCGFLASCTCPRVEGNANINGHVVGHLSHGIASDKSQANGHTNGHSHAVNGSNGVHTNGYVNGYANGHTHGSNGTNGVHSNGFNTRHTNGDAGANVKTLANGSGREEFVKKLQAGVDAIKHRGPDGSGVWMSDDGRVGFAHCRLSINDLSPSGSQPLQSDDGLIHAVVNGEIYDHDRLRKVCTAEHGYTFSSESDSEIVVAMYKIHGAPGLFEHLRGEFAFVLYDSREGSKKTIAGRDRFGIKPLLWTVLDDQILFSAEAKAFLPMGWKPEWDVRGITDAGWLLDDRTVFKGVRKLMPGHWMEITDERGVEIHKYWDAEYPDKVCYRRALGCLGHHCAGADSS